ncbi:hypothetical protein FRB96_003555 [Tulasnella sp. 330]|nr:hypothetical protein FRB96_003555 [Tulasnella sp. 330]KAG8886265.1 hypothetical protein FRB97_006269 [Tulasnella sp. 331]KAG8888336.1 hypothetical protein FRB98_007910 [Tulasnella sp. 332]
MTITPSHHAFTCAVIPECEAGSILIDMHCMAKSLKLADWRQIASSDIHVEDPKLADDGFIGTVVAVGRDVRRKGFMIGDCVGGYASEAKWFGTLDGANKVYLSVKPESVSEI